MTSETSGSLQLQCGNDRLARSILLIEDNSMDVDLTLLTWEGRFLARGETRWMRIESLPTRLENGNLVCDGVQIDVTERRQAQERLDRLAHTIR